MSSISITKLYSLLTDKVGKETAENLTTFIEEKIHDEIDSNLKILSTREDLANLKGELKTEMESKKNDIVKWMFVFWTGEAITTFGFILLFLKK